ncbi:MAG: hypothetical protein NNA31_00450 [Nitrospira sp.]|nr:hypothetical protein [Nitrospira sp.]
MSVGPGAEGRPSKPLRPSFEGKSAKIAKEGHIGRGGKTTSAKRDREKALQNIRKEKEARRALRKAEKNARPAPRDGEDPDLAGLRWGPQEPLY